MRSRKLLALSAALVVSQLVVRSFAVVPVEQIESYDTNDPGPGNDPYAPIAFNGSLTQTPTNGADGGLFNNITFHADAASGYDSATMSYHALSVGDDIYGQGVSPAYGFVTNVYSIWAGQFLGPSGTNPDTSVLKPQETTSAIGPLPGSFVGGAKIINNSYVGAENNLANGSPNVLAYEDDNRRIDYMVSTADVLWVGAAVTGGAGFSQAQYLAWSNFNGLSVSGVQNSLQNFSPAGSPGKQHADLSIPSQDASFATAIVSGYGAALWGNAQTINVPDAQHGVTVTSILMAGTDKNTYTRPVNASSGALDPIYGAGQPDYDNSLAILQSGEKSLLTVASNKVSAASSLVGTTQEGWSYGNISGGTQSVVLFQSTNSIQGLCASLNWDVTSKVVANGTELDTTSLVFPNLTLEVRPVSYNSSNSTYTLGASETDTTLHSAVSGDNIQYLYNLNGLPAGTYAFLITGDPSLTATVGLSYSLTGVFASQWKASTGGTWETASSWTNGIPNGEAAVANLLSSPGITSASTINLVNDVTLGQLIINNPNTYTIASTGGTLKIDASGDPNYNPAIIVQAGVQVITTSVHFDYLLTANVSSGATLNMSGGLTGNPVLTKIGAGLLILNAADSYGSTNITGGTLSLGSSGSLTGLITVGSGAVLNFGANTGGGFLVRSEQITLNTGGAITLSQAIASSDRQLLIAPGLNVPAVGANWSIDLSNNDLDLPGASLATVTSQLKQGCNAGKWNGTGGIISTAAMNNSAHLTALGVIQNNQNGSTIFNASNPFDSTTPGATDILVKYTWYGDANLDGEVDGSDYSLIDSAFLADKTNPTAVTGWYNGDFNYDGLINGTDYTLIDNAFNRQGASLSAAVSTDQTATVPEPASIGIVLIAAASLRRRRRR